MEWVIGRAGDRVHLVGHSFGGLVSLAVALRNRVELASLTILDAPAIEILPQRNEHLHYRAMRRMTDAYFKSFHDGNAEAIAAMGDAGEATLRRCLDDANPFVRDMATQALFMRSVRQESAA